MLLNVLFFCRGSERTFSQQCIYIYIWLMLILFSRFLWVDIYLYSSFSHLSKHWRCIDEGSSFCHVCGDFTTVAQCRTITFLFRTISFHCFDYKIGHQNKSWAPHICCKPRYNGLTAWFNGKNNLQFCCSDGLERATKPCGWLLFLSNKYNWFQCFFDKKTKYPNLSYETCSTLK